MKRNIIDIEKQMQEEWNTLCNNPVKVSEESIIRIKSRIDSDIHAHQNRHKILARISAAAASIAIILLTYSTITLYREKQTVSSNMVSINTSTGETACITLPDGSKAHLNYESVITYVPYEFGLDSRTINMKGEVFFEIAKDAEKPFIINTQSIRLQVLGTKFNLCTRNADGSTLLTLDEGSVSILSLKSGEKARITEGEEMRIDSKGKITIFKPEHLTTGGWKERRLMFRNIPIGDVINEVSKIYGIKFTIDDTINLTEPFTGILASNNLPGVLDVLEIVFDFKVTMLHKEIKITNKKQEKK